MGRDHETLQSRPGSGPQEGAGFVQEESDGLRDRTHVEVDVGKGLSRKWDPSRLKPGYSQLRLTWLPVSKVSSQRAAGSAR